MVSFCPVPLFFKLQHLFCICVCAHECVYMHVWVHSHSHAKAYIWKNSGKIFRSHFLLFFPSYGPKDWTLIIGFTYQVISPKPSGFFLNDILPNLLDQQIFQNLSWRLPPSTGFWAHSLAERLIGCFPDSGLCHGAFVTFLSHLVFMKMVYIWGDLKIMKHQLEQSTEGRLSVQLSSAGVCV